MLKNKVGSIASTTDAVTDFGYCTTVQQTDYVSNVLVQWHRIGKLVIADISFYQHAATGGTIWLIKGGTMPVAKSKMVAGYVRNMDTGEAEPIRVQSGGLIIADSSAPGQYVGKVVYETN